MCCGVVWCGVVFGVGAVYARACVWKERTRRRAFVDMCLFSYFSRHTHKHTHPRTKRCLLQHPKKQAYRTHATHTHTSLLHCITLRSTTHTDTRPHLHTTTHHCTAPTPTILTQHNIPHHFPHHTTLLPPLLRLGLSCHTFLSSHLMHTKANTPP